jgi:hypothetical protein
MFSVNVALFHHSQPKPLEIHYPYSLVQEAFTFKGGVGVGVICLTGPTIGKTAVCKVQVIWEE